MTVLLVLLLVLALGVVAAVAAGWIGGGLPEPMTDTAPPLEHGVRAPADLDEARFALGFRGYRMDQVDDVLDGARDALAARDREIEELRRQLAACAEGHAGGASARDAYGDRGRRS